MLCPLRASRNPFSSPSTSPSPSPSTSPFTFPGHVEEFNSVVVEHHMKWKPLLVGGDEVNESNICFGGHANSAIIVAAWYAQCDSYIPSIWYIPFTGRVAWSGADTWNYCSVHTAPKWNAVRFRTRKCTAFHTGTISCDTFVPVRCLYSVVSCVCSVLYVFSPAMWKSRRLRLSGGGGGREWEEGVPYSSVGDSFTRKVEYVGYART